MRVGLAVLVAILLQGCTINLVRKSAEPEVIKQKVEYFQWLYQKGFFNSDPELMKKAASKLLEVDSRDREPPVEALERVLHGLEDAIERLQKDKR